MQIIHGIAVMLFYLLTFTFTGSLLPEKAHKNALGKMLLAGFMMYFSLFQLTALPMKLKKQRLSRLSAIWLVVLILIWAAAILLRRRCLREAFTGAWKTCREHPWCVTGLISALSLCVLLGLNVNHISDYDAGYYIGLPTSSVYSDTIERVNPYTGKRKSTFNDFYFLNTNTIHSAVIYQKLKLHPLIEEKFTLTMTLTLLFCVILYQAALYLFHGDQKKAVLTGVLSMLVLLFSYSLSGVSHYFAYRTYEGKSITAYLYMAAVFLFFLAVYYEKDKWWGWCGLFFSALSSAVFCNTAIYVVPGLIGILFLPDLFQVKVWKNRLMLPLVLLPSVMWIGLYLTH